MAYLSVGLRVSTWSEGQKVLKVRKLCRSESCEGQKSVEGQKVLMACIYSFCMDKSILL